jgi:hypothetical protein
VRASTDSQMRSRPGGERVRTAKVRRREKGRKVCWIGINHSICNIISTINTIAVDFFLSRLSSVTELAVGCGARRSEGGKGTD